MKAAEHSDGPRMSSLQMTTEHDTVPLLWSLKVGLLAMMAFAFAVAPTLAAVLARPYLDGLKARIYCAGAAHSAKDGAP